MRVFRDAIVKHLQADVQIAPIAKVYPGLPPKKDAQFPFITVTAQQGQKAERVFQKIEYEGATILVKAIDQNTSPKRVGQINRLIRASLNDYAPLVIPGYGLINLMWIQDVEYSEEIDGVIYQYEGGFYLVQAAFI